MDSSCPSAGAAGTGLWAPGAGSWVVPPSPSMGVLMCLEHCPAMKSWPRTSSVDTCYMAAMARVTLPDACPHVLQPGHAEPQEAALLSFPRLQLLPGGSLQINPVQVQDSGYYLCMASSPAGSDWQGLDLQILGKRMIQMDPSWAHPCPTRGCWAALISATMCCCSLLITTTCFHSPSWHHPWALQPHAAGSAASHTEL